jgi:hypothetical protein
VVGDVEVVQGSGMGVVAQGGDGVSVAEPSLGLEILPSPTSWVPTLWRRR